MFKSMLKLIKARNTVKNYLSSKITWNGKILHTIRLAYLPLLFKYQLIASRLTSVRFSQTIIFLEGLRMNLREHTVRNSNLKFNENVVTVHYIYFLFFLSR